MGGRVRGSAREVKSGDVLHLTRAASVQFLRPILVRVIRLPDWVTYDGWLWIEGYELARRARRSYGGRCSCRRRG